MRESDIFLLFANCMVVKGANRSIICDLQRGEFDFIPNDLTEILTNHKRESIADIKKNYNLESAIIINEYFEFLVSKEYGFWGTNGDFDLFPEIDLNWYSSSIITNSIIDVDENSEHNFEKIFQELEELGCRDIQLRFYFGTTKEHLEKIACYLNFSRIKSVEFIIKDSQELRYQDIESLTNNYPRIRNVIIHSAQEYKIARINKINGRGNIIYITDIIDSQSHCGKIHYSNFVINLPTYIESQKYNSCLNGKISIDVRGNIKNCPSMNKSYGNVSNISLKEVSLKEDIKELWSVNKEQIKICKDCEFRHICTDCRAFLDDSNDIYSKPLKCNYNPYTSQWAN